MKLIIEIPDDVYNKITEIYNSYEELHIKENLYQTIVNGKPYEEQVDLNEVKAIAEKAEQERPQGDLIHSLTELCNRYCKNCPVIGETPNLNDCSDCICTHIRGIMNEVKDE